ncbi:DUF1648 domain-containing protein [Brevibacterium sp. FME17]|uniref:DUF1648 domain-containing protein n=1 Tax=Brevibacterium sp. FME17 TaxID=2742606 RepID=UPI001867B107|nr:DUF1648 domain-containing protein [Brevibacterium sp. FME17]
MLFAVLSILVFVGFAVWLWFNAPDQAPSHSGANGQPDDWSQKGEVMAWLVPLGVGIPALLSIRQIYEKLPIGLVNVPHKDYWLKRGERDYLFDCLMEFMRITAGACALLFTLSLAQTLKVGISRSWPEALLFLPTGVFLVVVAIAMWNLLRQLKPDGRDERNPKPQTEPEQ